jgi:hypothetical protein
VVIWERWKNMGKKCGKVGKICPKEKMIRKI